MWSWWITRDLIKLQRKALASNLRLESSPFRQYKCNEIRMYTYIYKRNPIYTQFVFLFFLLFILLYSLFLRFPLSLSHPFWTKCRYLSHPTAVLAAASVSEFPLWYVNDLAWLSTEVQLCQRYVLLFISWIPMDAFCGRNYAVPRGLFTYRSPDLLRNGVVKFDWMNYFGKRKNWMGKLRTNARKTAFFFKLVCFFSCSYV